VIFELVRLVSLLFIDSFGTSDVVLTIFYIVDLLPLVGQVLIVLGLVGLYIRQSQVVGAAGLIAFLLAFIGMVLIRALYWTASLAYLGWALFGTLSLQARVYPRIPSVILIISSLATTLARPTASPLPVAADDVSGYIGAVSFIMLNAVIAWLGFLLLTRRGEEDQPAVQTC
jgi:hypothetical protein